ncbi:M28 family peptidase [Stakelama tenebrarum]|uniref:M20/M25/M40 family metallo-hydrolase n=1 Tax=Stakelama tenebrarum TaxID=2711215 RepID=A0A6G6YA16_9SPHN|nr:M28 family peptidase [Sphingosinithalassobacter tenebrarum]QIG81416.1 M20/M25/M40 family metallo-hydrolase [Sphingosinithalassobacter tenebrarum]
MRFSLLLTAVSLALAPAAAVAQTADEPTFSAERVKADVTFLASDELEGRNAGDRGYDVAAKFVATRFESMGLEPGGPDGSWYQMVPFAEVGLEGTPTMMVDGAPLQQGKDMLIGAGSSLEGGEQTIVGNAVFVGHGMVSEEHGIDDYAGVDATGKFVVYFVGPPSDLAPEQMAALRSINRVKVAADHGAIGVLMVLRPQDVRIPWEQLGHYVTGAQLQLLNADGTSREEAAPGGIQISAYIRPETLAPLLEGTDMTVEGALEAADTVETTAFELPHQVTLTRNVSVRRFESPNVIGLLPGSDPELKDEYVLLTAHLDHNGIDREKEGDQIYNGAMDNAGGTATMLEAARAFTSTGTSPRRSIMFVSLTAEEDGLLGSEFLANNWFVEGGTMVADVNLDMPVLLYDFKDVVAFGAEHSTLGPIVAEATAKADVSLSPDPMPEENLFVRSDHYSFVKAGVPSVFLVTGFENGGEEAFRHFLATDYHQPSDQIDLPFDWDAAAKFARINFLIAREIANADTAPMWYEGNEYGDRYAPDAAKAPAPAVEEEAEAEAAE